MRETVKNNTHMKISKKKKRNERKLKIGKSNLDEKIRITTVRKNLKDKKYERNKEKLKRLQRSQNIFILSTFASSGNSKITKSGDNKRLLFL